MSSISVIVTAANEEKTISKAIRSILSQLNKNDELIVVAPDDPTLASAKKVSSRVKTIRDKGEGKPSALNLAVEQTKNKILVLTDGDVYVDKKALKHLFSPLKDKKTGIVSGQPVPTNSKNNLYGFWAHLATQIAHQQRLQRLKTGLPLDCSGYLLAFRKKLFTPFSKNTLGEDSLLSQNINSQGYQTQYAPQAKVYVKYHTNLIDCLKQKFRSVGGATVQSRSSMRGPLSEIAQIPFTLKLIKTLPQFFYWLSAFFFRFCLWILIFINLKLRKPTLKLWSRTESTKN